MTRFGVWYDMKLSRYLRLRQISSRQFARKMGVSVFAVRKWRAQQRMPRPHHINRIKKLTEGVVRYEDWFRRKNRMDKR
jgi:hypothetical protein